MWTSISEVMPTYESSRPRLVRLRCSVDGGDLELGRDGLIVDDAAEAFATVLAEVSASVGAHVIDLGSAHVIGPTWAAAGGA